MMNPSYFALVFSIFLFSTRVNASAGTDACKAGACLEFRALSKTCGYDLDKDQVINHDESRCICGDRGYQSSSTACFDCMADQESLINYTKVDWDNKCFEAFDKKPPQKSDGAKGIARQGGGRYAVCGILVTAGVGLMG